MVQVEGNEMGNAGAQFIAGLHDCPNLHYISLKLGSSIEGRGLWALSHLRDIQGSVWCRDRFLACAPALATLRMDLHGSNLHGAGMSMLSLLQSVT